MPDSDPASASADKKPMTTRRFHRKSRNGCVECKNRRVKCDEAFPTCSNCMRSRSTCLYSIAKDAAHPRSPTTQAVPDFAAPVNIGPAPGAFDLLDLTVMHHYSTVTAVRLFPGEYSRQVWQNILPVQARTHPLLMHGLLSLASMDLARSPSSLAADPTISRPPTSPNEQDDYRTRALHHQTMGIRIFKAQLAETPAQNADILFLFSIILVILAFAFPQTCNAPPTVDGILNLFNLLRGSKVVWKQDDSKVRSSPSATWFQHRDDSKSVTSLELTPAILSRFNILRLQAMDPADTVAIDQLFACIQEFAANPGDFSTIGRWPTVVYEDFWERLKAHQTIPLFILAHFCIVLGGFQKEWWTSNWDRMLLNAVELTLSEDDKQRVGWNTDTMLDLAQFAQ